MLKLSPDQQTPKWESSKSTFVRNLALPVHGWFRFPAGFSAEWVEDVIQRRKDSIRSLAFLDPFAGVGTAVLSAEKAGVAAYGIEAQPFIARVSQAKLLWHTSPRAFHRLTESILNLAHTTQTEVPFYPPLIHKCYTTEAVSALHQLRCAWEELSDSSAASKLAWLAITAILRACSSVGTAPWQYVLPRKSKAKTVHPYEAFGLQTQRMLADMLSMQSLNIQHQAEVLQQDARTCAPISDSSVGLVVTSPPYANNYDYADATRLEMTFWGEVRGWGDLHEKARQYLVRSCSQHVSLDKASITPLLKKLSDTPFSTEISNVCEALYGERANHGGKKDYHLMVAAYFSDMKDVWSALRRVCAANSEVCFVIGDSAPYGVHVPVETWMGELALVAGFEAYEFEKIRERNVKWKNRKHRVPLQEGLLWVKG